MIYGYGWPRAKDPAKTAEDFEKLGFSPGLFWGGIVIGIELLGGLAVLAGVVVWLAATLFGLELLLDTIWKTTKAGKSVPDFSNDLVMLGLCLVLILFGPGRWALGS